MLPGHAGDREGGSEGNRGRETVRGEGRLCGCFYGVYIGQPRKYVNFFLHIKFEHTIHTVRETVIKMHVCQYIFFSQVTVSCFMGFFGHCNLHFKKPIYLFCFYVVTYSLRVQRSFFFS